MIPYTSLENVLVKENHDPMDNLLDHELLIGLKYSKLPASTKDSLYLRRDVCKKIRQAENLLRKTNPDYRVINVYAYRSLSVQRSSFNDIKRKLGLENRNDTEANEQIHHYIAVPEVSGHPTGGAIDLLIEDGDGNPLDFGTDIHSMEEASQVFSPDINSMAKENRALLRKIMLDVGFAPYDGEWWHFSYGDREWASYYKEQYAIYTQIEKFV